jgi:hypothetical protein
MTPGPVLIFDKSFLQSLNPDESVWLDHFFITNITPLFFIEALADLAKAIRGGRTPEQVVSNLAYKTPDMQSSPNAHHRALLTGELSGLYAVPLDWRLRRAGGTRVELDGKAGVMFHKTDEEEAFDRWRDGKFLDLERQIASRWRKNLSGVDFTAIYNAFQRYYQKGKPKELSQVKKFADRIIDGADQEGSLIFGLSLLGYPPGSRAVIGQRYRDVGKPPLRDFAPYFCYLYSVELFFNLGIAADLISKERPSNKIDLAYLYYLPFCQIFTSTDNLHEKVVPLFLREDQSFVKGPELKADLRKLDEHYSALPNGVKAEGLYHFAKDPPTEGDFLVSKLYDRHRPGWRKAKTERKELPKELQEALVQMMNRIDKDSRSADPRERITMEETEFIQITRQVHSKKGKWVRIKPDAKKDSG